MNAIKFVWQHFILVTCRPFIILKLSRNRGMKQSCWQILPPWHHYVYLVRIFIEFRSVDKSSLNCFRLFAKRLDKKSLSVDMSDTICSSVEFSSVVSDCWSVVASSVRVLMLSKAKSLRRAPSTFFTQKCSRRCGFWTWSQIPFSTWLVRRFSSCHALNVSRTVHKWFETREQALTGFKTLF